MSCKGGQSPPFIGKYESTLCEGDFDYDGDVNNDSLADLNDDNDRRLSYICNRIWGNNL